MGSLLKHFVQICIFRKGPQDLPTSSALPLFALLFNQLAGLSFALVDPRLMAVRPLLRLLLEAMLTIALSWTLLRLAHKGPRFPQTVSALLAADACVALCALPIVAVLHGTGHPQLFKILLSILFIWLLIINSWIFRHALSISLGYATLIAVAYTVASNQVIAFLGFGG